MLRLWIVAAALGCAALGDTGASAASRVPPVNPAKAPPAAAVRPVTEDYFGTRITDPYRYLEDLKNAEVSNWMLAQGEYTRRILDSIKPRAALLQHVSTFGAGFGVVVSYQTYGGRSFYLERAPGADNYDLMVRDAEGAARKIIDTEALRKADGLPHAINYYQASPDGRLIAAGVSAGGSEDASLSVYDAVTGKVVAGPLTRAQFGAVAWTQDSKGLTFNRLQALPSGAPRVERYNNSAVAYWDLKGEPADLAGAKAGRGPKLDAIQIPAMILADGSPVAVLAATAGVQNEVSIWIAPLARMTDAAAPWRRLTTPDDGVTGGALLGGDVYLLSHKDAPTFQVLKLAADADLAAAKVVLPARPGVVLTGISAGRDGVYVAALEGVYSKLYRLPAAGGPAEDVVLPFKGSIVQVFADTTRDGAVVQLQSWAQPIITLAYDPASRAFTDLKLGVRPPFDPKAYAVDDLSAQAKDGTGVPLSVVRKAGPVTARPFYLEAYGSYGISSTPVFSPRIIALVDEGGSHATCHVRGGGELGEAWRLGGKDANKPNTWRDLIACAETLIAKGYTTAEQLMIVGGSAGGITVGMAMAERPDLFAAVADEVPMASALRAEHQVNGPANIPEFGTVADPQGFKNLLAMDSYQAVKDGVRRPAVLLTTGMNDPRVDPWQPAKMAARLQAAGGGAPALLRVETQGGHGIGSTKSQRDAEFADVVSFLFWRAGLPPWQPAR